RDGRGSDGPAEEIRSPRETDGYAAAAVAAPPLSGSAHVRPTKSAPIEFLGNRRFPYAAPASASCTSAEPKSENWETRPMQDRSSYRPRGWPVHTPSKFSTLSYSVTALECRACHRYRQYLFIIDVVPAAIDEPFRPAQPHFGCVSHA